MNYRRQILRAAYKLFISKGPGNAFLLEQLIKNDTDIRIFEGEFNKLLIDNFIFAKNTEDGRVTCLNRDKITEIKNEIKNIDACFIVHGHNEGKKYEVARFVESLNKKAIILHETVSAGRTIIEKFEDNSNVDFAIAIWTADDLGKGKTSEVFNNRARQNVIFETDFFIGKLGRENVIVLFEEGVEIPSDYSGIIFLGLNGNWKEDLRGEINEIYKNVIAINL